LALPVVHLVLVAHSAASVDAAVCFAASVDAAVCFVASVVRSAASVDAAVCFVASVVRSAASVDAAVCFVAPAVRLVPVVVHSLLAQRLVSVLHRFYLIVHLSAV
jgi:hypothetical protein